MIKNVPGKNPGFIFRVSIKRCGNTNSVLHMITCNKTEVYFEFSINVITAKLASTAVAASMCKRQSQLYLQHYKLWRRNILFKGLFNFSGSICQEIYIRIYLPFIQSLNGEKGYLF